MTPASRAALVSVAALCFGWAGFIGSQMGQCIGSGFFSPSSMGIGAALAAPFLLPAMIPNRYAKSLLVACCLGIAGAVLVAGAFGGPVIFGFPEIRERSYEGWVIWMMSSAAIAVACSGAIAILLSPFFAERSESVSTARRWTGRAAWAMAGAGILGLVCAGIGILGFEIEPVVGVLAAVALGVGLAIACRPASRGDADDLCWSRLPLVLFFLPFVLVPGTYQLALLLAPGTVLTSQWQHASFGVFLICALPVTVLLMRSPLHRIAQLVVATVTVLVLTSAAFFVYEPPRFEEQKAYIGPESKGRELFASCG